MREDGQGEPISFWVKRAHHKIRAICKKVALFTYLFTQGTSCSILYVCINHKDTFYSDNKWCEQRIIQFTDEKLKTKVQIEDGFIYIMN